MFDQLLAYFCKVLARVNMFNIKHKFQEKSTV